MRAAGFLLLLVLAGCQYNPAEQLGYEWVGPGKSYQPPPPPPVGPVAPTASAAKP